jgi:hypothetical protein
MKPIKNTPPLRCPGAGLRPAGAAAGTAAKRPRATTRESSAAAEARRRSTPDAKDYKRTQRTGGLSGPARRSGAAARQTSSPARPTPTWPCAAATRESCSGPSRWPAHARRLDLVLELARLWVEVEPDSKRAQQVLVGVLIMSNQLEGLAPQLIRMLEADKDALPANLLALNRMFARSPDRQAVLQLISQVVQAILRSRRSPLRRRRGCQRCGPAGTGTR